jgi:hypothetical protein
MLYNFPIESGKPISDRFLQHHIIDFSSAIMYVRDLPYKRNSRKDHPPIVLEEQGGTCSTKHALLKVLADENRPGEVKLIMGIFKMNAENTKAVKEILEKYQLEYIPEAHNYLKMGNKIIDATKRSFADTLFAKDLLDEEEISFHQVGNYKVEKHRAYLDDWLTQNPRIPYHLPRLWEIREECIAALATQ